MFKQEEETPVIQKVWTELREAYGGASHCKFENGVVVDYEPYKMASLRTLCMCKGTVLVDPVLLFEQVILTGIFLLAAVPLYALQSDQISWGDKESRVYHYEKLVEQEGPIRKFSMIITSLAALLLSLYTSIMIARWWTIRTQGVGAIKGAATELVLYISQFVTQDEEMLNAIQRYARASLKLIFLWRRMLIADEDVVRADLLSNNILKEEEIDELFSKTWNHNLYESIWCWNVSIVQTLWAEDKIKNPEMLMLLLEKCAEGRAGVALIATHLTTKVPMVYVHLLGFIVKLHNLICALLMGVLFSLAVKERNVLVCVQLFGRTLIMPFLFNAILMINSEISDPFDGQESDFPDHRYDMELKRGTDSMLEAGLHLPTWLQERRSNNAMYKSK